jgi:pyrroloquinoline quinone biosynthesis protein E
MLTGNAAATDPVCSKSAEHHRVEEELLSAARATEQPIVFRNPKNARKLAQTGNG